MSKNIPITAIIILIFILGSCQIKDTKNKTINAAGQLLDSSPDSAYKLLSSMERPEELPQRDYAAWCLHFTHAQYKLNYNIKSDSLIRISIEFYDSKNYDDQAGTAYYLQGTILESQGLNERALEAYKNALEKLLNTDDLRMLGLTNFNIAYLYMNDKLFRTSLLYFNKSLVYFKLNDNNLDMACTYRFISDMYSQMNYPIDSILYYSNLSMSYSRKLNTPDLYYEMVSRQGELYHNVDINKSKQYMLRAYKYNPEKFKYNSLYLAYLYSKLNRQDSAQYFLDILRTDSAYYNSNELPLFASAYISKSKKDYNRAFEYLEKAYLKHDSLFNIKSQSQLYLIDKQYDLTQKEKENAKLTIANRNKVIWITLLIIVVLFALIISLLINNQHKKQQALLEMEKQRLKFEAETNRISNLQKRELLLSKLNHKIDNTLKFNRMQKGVMQTEKYEAFLEMITKESILSENEWQYYIDEVNNLYDNKVKDLQNNYTELTLTDLIVIVLILLNVNISDACSLMNMTKNTMYVRRKTIKKRLGIGNEVELEDWISQNITRESI